MNMTRRDLVASIAASSLIGLSGCRSPIKETTMSQTDSTMRNDRIPHSSQSQADSLRNDRIPHSSQSQADSRVAKQASRKRILHIVTNVNHYDDVSHPTGLWLSELTHAYDVFSAEGYEQQIVSPQGGKVPIEPRSLKWPYFDKSAREGQACPVLSELLANSAKPDGISAADFDAIYFTGGHGVMWDFPDNARLQAITRDIFERGGIVSSVCHGYAGLLNTKLSDGSFLVAGRRLTGYSWTEEVLAGVAKKVPYDVEARMRERGARYEKNLLPFTSNVVVDGRLVTGQNPQSAKATARKIVGLL
jgi:putative intracellular protease/amidase